jgi:hypothetical protein
VTKAAAPVAAAFFVRTRFASGGRTVGTVESVPLRNGLSEPVAQMVVEIRELAQKLLSEGNTYQMYSIESL